MHRKRKEFSETCIRKELGVITLSNIITVNYFRLPIFHSIKVLFLTLIESKVHNFIKTLSKVPCKVQEPQEWWLISHKHTLSKISIPHFKKLSNFTICTQLIIIKMRRKLLILSRIHAKSILLQEQATLELQNTYIHCGQVIKKWISKNILVLQVA